MTLIIFSLFYLVSPGIGFYNPIYKNENEIPNSNSLKPLEFDRKTNIGDINSSTSDNEEEGVEAVVWRCSAAGSVENMFLEISQYSQENFCASLL